MKPEVDQLGASHEASEGSRKRIRWPGHPVVTRADQIVVSIGRADRETPDGLLRLVEAQRLDGKPRQHHGAASTFGLGCLDPQSVLCLLE